MLPLPAWTARCTRRTLADDAVAACVVTAMLTPQALAYASLAGMPPEAGLYAAVAGLAGYALLGGGGALSVAPVAVVSLMTASALGRLEPAGPGGYAAAAGTLAALSGAMLLAGAALRLGFVAHFISRPVVSAFVTGSALLIILSQARHFLGVEAGGGSAPEMAGSLLAAAGEIHPPTLAAGAASVALLLWWRAGLPGLLMRLGAPERPAALLARAGPLALAAAAVALAGPLDAAGRGVALLGPVPAGLPRPALPLLAPMELVLALAGPAALIAAVGFVESVSVGQALAARRRERIEPTREMGALGLANLGAGLCGGFPVSGGFARSVVNFEAGAKTPAAGLMAAAGVAAAAVWLAPALARLPEACLAAVVATAVAGLADFSVFRRSWRHSRADFAAPAATLAATLAVGVEAGLAAGVAASVALHLHRASRPHVAVVGRVPGTEHFRNVERHRVETVADQLSLRVDESLFFANCRLLEERIFALAAERPELRHVILLCAAVNRIDLSALESLEAVDGTLAGLGIRLHLSEVKGPVMDRLAGTDFLRNLSGNCYLSHHQAVEELRRGG